MADYYSSDEKPEKKGGKIFKGLDLPSYAEVLETFPHDLKEYPNSHEAGSKLNKRTLKNVVFRGMKDFGAKSSGFTHYVRYCSPFLELSQVNVFARGLDINFAPGCGLELAPGRSRIFTGIRLEPNFRFDFLVTGSSHVTKYGLDVQMGLVDADYSGEIFVDVDNKNSHTVRLVQNMRLAQLVPLDKGGEKIGHVLPIRVTAEIYTKDMKEIRRGWDAVSENYCYDENFRFMNHMHVPATLRDERCSGEMSEQEAKEANRRRFTQYGPKLWAMPEVMAHKDFWGTPKYKFSPEKVRPYIDVSLSRIIFTNDNERFKKYRDWWQTAAKNNWKQEFTFRNINVDGDDLCKRAVYNGRYLKGINDIDIRYCLFESQDWRDLLGLDQLNVGRDDAEEAPRVNDVVMLDDEEPWDEETGEGVMAAVAAAEQSLAVENVSTTSTEEEETIVNDFKVPVPPPKRGKKKVRKSKRLN